MIFPAIDLKNKQSVRLYQGDFQQVTKISADPLVQVQKLVDAGIKVLHLVDLDGAKSGQPQNFVVIKAIRQKFKGLIEIGGGIRNLATIESYLNLGIDRVILGSIALKKPQLVKEALKLYGPEKIVVGIDGRDGKVSIDGWLNESQVTMEALIGKMVKYQVKYFIVTDIKKDGTLSGPNFELLAGLQKKYPQVQIIASGGVRNLADVRKLRARGIRNVITGKALFAQTLTLKEISEENQNVS